jgi:hypothetical protein
MVGSKQVEEMVTEGGEHMTGPLAFILSLVGSAILSRPKRPELDPNKTLLTYIAELKEKLRICEAARDAARADRDQSDAQLRTITSPYQPHAEVENEELRRLRQAHDALLRMFVEEQRTRLQLERDLIASEARVEALRSNAHRQQAPRHLPVPVPLTSQEAQRLTAQALAQLAQMRAMREPALMPANLERAMRQMDAFICNCAPARHELFNINKGDQIEGDDTL